MPDQTPLYEEVQRIFDEAVASPDGEWLLRGYVQDEEHLCRFEIKDGDSFYARFKDGVVKVLPGRVSEISYDTLRITSDQATVREVLSGRLRPFDAKRLKRWEAVCRDRRGGLFTTLLRIGQDLRREAALGVA